MRPESRLLSARAQRHLIILAGVGGSAVYQFTWTIAGVALPHMQGTFSASPDQISWVMTAFIMGTVGAIAASGWLAARYGRKQVYLVSIAGFTVSLLLCGAATSLEEEVVWRLASGIFGAALMPLGQAITVDAFPPQRHGAATAVWSIGLMGGGIMGPVAGGAVVDFMSWPWVFYLNIPLGILAFLIALVALPASKPDPAHKLDWFGFVTIIVAVTAFQALFNRAERLDWFSSTEILAEAAVGALALYLFIAHSLTTERPFFRPILFRDRNFNLGLVAAFANGTVATLPLVIMPLMLQLMAGYPALDAGVLMFPRGLGLVLASFALARYDSHLPPKYTMVAGIAVLLIAGSAMATWTADVGAWEVAWVNLAHGAGAGAIFIAINSLTFATLDVRLKTEGFAVYYTVLFSGATIGIAVIVAVLTRMTQVAHAVVGAHINPFNESFRLLPVPDIWDRSELAGLAALEREVTRQAQMIAYSDSFLVAALIPLAVLPLVFLFRTPKREIAEG